jgi:hypothetical protein
MPSSDSPTTATSHGRHMRRWRRTGQVLAAAQFQQVFTALRPAVGQLLTMRLKQYDNGVPPDPTAELPAMSFLVDSDNWKNQNTQQQTEVIQLMLNLMSDTGQRAAARPPESRAELLSVTTSALGTLVRALQNNNVTYPPELETIHSTLSEGAPASDAIDAAVKTATDGVVKAAGVDAPAPLGPAAVPSTGEAATEPATEPTTVPGANF